MALLLRGNVGRFTRGSRVFSLTAKVSLILSWRSSQFSGVVGLFRLRSLGFSGGSFAAVDGQCQMTCSADSSGWPHSGQLAPPCLCLWT